MFPIEQSSFLHALGYAIGHSLWQMPMLWLVYYVLIHIGTWPSNRRYALAVSMSVTGFGWFLLTLGYYATRLQVADSADSIAIVWQQVNQPASEPKGFLFIYHSVMATLRSLAPYLSCAYLVVMMVLSVRLSYGFRQVKQLRSVGISKAAVDWRLFVNDHAKLLGIKKKVQVLVSSIATSPYTIGFFKPIILIPLASINHLSTQQMEAILLHELAHIRRHDYLLNIVLQIVEISLFFNPFMRLLLKQAKLERENCCDDWVLQFQYNPADYARALLAIEKYSMQSMLAMGSNNNNEFELLNRVKRMVAPERQSFNYRQQLGLLLFITFLGLGFTVVVPRPATASANTDKTISQPKIVAEQKKVASPEKKLEKTAAPAVDLVKALEGIQLHIQKAVDSKEFNAQSEQMQVEAEKIAEQIQAESQTYLQQIEYAANDIETSGDKVGNELDALKASTAIKTSIKMAEMYANTNWDKIIGPALEQSGKALAMIPGIFGNKGEQSNVPEPPSPPTPPNPPARLQFEKRQRTLDAAQRALQAKLKAGEQLTLNLGNFRRMVADSIRISFDKATVDFTRSQEEFEKANIRLPKAREARFRAAAKASPRVQTYDFAYNNSYNSNSNGANTVWYNGKNDEDDNQADDNVNDDEDDDDNGNINIVSRKSPCAVTPAVAPKGRTETSRSTSTIVLNGKVLNKKVKKEWVDVQQNWEQVWNNDKLQQEIQQVQDEVQKGLKELEKFNIKTNISTKGSRNGKVITIEVETLK